jgi:hypothetical protein
MNSKAKEQIAAALVSPSGDVVMVIAIARATDEEIRAAEERAEAAGFKLVVQEVVPLVQSEAALREVILATASP